MIGLIMNSLERSRHIEPFDKKVILTEIGKIQNIIYETMQNLTVPAQQKVTFAKIFLLKIGQNTHERLRLLTIIHEKL